MPIAVSMSASRILGTLWARGGSLGGEPARGSGVRLRSVLVRVLWVVGLAALAIHALHVGFGVDVGGSSGNQFVEVWCYFLAQLAPGLLVVLRGLEDRCDRLAWLLFGLGICAYATGAPVYALVVEQQAAYSFPSSADVLWLALYPCVYAGVLLLARRRLRGLRAGLWLDGLITSLAVAALAAALALDPLLSAIGGTFTNLVINSVWAVGDLAVVALLVGVVALSDWRPGRGLWLLLFGFVVLAAADVLYLVQVTASGGYALGVWRDSLYPARCCWSPGVLGADAGCRRGAAAGLAVAARAARLWSDCARNRVCRGPAADERALRRSRGIDAAGGAYAPGGELPREPTLRARTPGASVARAAQREAELRALSERRFRVAFGDAPIGMALVSAHPEDRGRYLEVNRALCEMVGRSEQELLASSLVETTHPDDRDSHFLAPGEMLTAERAAAVEQRYLHADGHTLWASVNASLLRDEEGEATAYGVHVLDTTARHEYEQQLEHRALYDMLSGLPNRALFERDLERALARQRRHGGYLCVMFLDIDRFKTINDSLGHAIGDRVLVAVGERLKAVLRPHDTLARFGGDEFTILCDGLEPPGAVTEIAQRMICSLEAPLLLETGETFTLTASIGVALADDHSDAASLVRDADVAMYHAKDRGRAGYALFDEALRARAIRRLETESTSGCAEPGATAPLSSQSSSIPEGEIIGMEALLRWEPPGSAWSHPATSSRSPRRPV